MSIIDDEQRRRIASDEVQTCRGVDERFMPEPTTHQSLSIRESRRCHPMDGTPFLHHLGGDGASKHGLPDSRHPRQAG